MKKKIIISSLGLLGFLTSPCQEIMTLATAIRIGLQNNYGINIARNELQRAKNDATIGNAGFLPEVDLTGSYTYGYGNAKVEVVSNTELNNSQANSNLVTGGINLTWTLFDGLNMFIRYDQLKKFEEMGDLNVRITLERTIAGIITAYYNIIRQAEEIGIKQEQVDISRFRLDLAHTRYLTGSGSEMEWLKARVELNADLASLADQKTSFENAKTYLNQLLARDINMSFVVNDTIILTDTLVYDTVRQQMFQNNHELQLAEKTYETFLLNMRAARAQQFPSLDLMAGYNYSRNETEAAFINYNRYAGLSIGLTASMKLFDGLNLQRQYRDAKFLARTSELNLRELELRLEADLKRVFNDYTNQMQLVGFENENLILAKKNMDIAKESYQLGIISSLQLREIQKDLLEARVRLLTAEFKTKVKETELLLLSASLEI